MLRFWVASIILHGFVLALLLRDGALVLSPPTSLSVELEKSKKRMGLPAPNTPTKNLAAPSKIPSEKTTHLEPNEGMNSSPEIFEAGSVSVLPKILKEVRVPYPESAKKARAEGDVFLSVVISPDGRVQETQVIKGPGFGLNEAAELALKDFRFSPAERNGEKVPVRIQYIYHFKLNEI